MRSSARCPSSTSSRCCGPRRSSPATRRGARSIRSSRASCSNEKLRQALSFHTLLVGGNPMTTSAIYALIHKLERDGGVWFAQGRHQRAGRAAWCAISSGSAARPARRSGRGDRDATATRVTGVRTKSGWRGTFDAVASNADVVHSYDLLEGHRRGPAAAAQAAAQALLAVPVRRPFRRRAATWPDVPHHTILFGPRYEALLDDIYDAAGSPTIPRSISTIRPPPTRRWRRRAARPSTRWRRCRISASCRSTGTSEGAGLSPTASSTSSRSG